MPYSRIAGPIEEIVLEKMFTASRRILTQIGKLCSRALFSLAWPESDNAPAGKTGSGHARLGFAVVNP